MRYLESLSLNSYDIYLFHEGNHFRSYEFMGAHLSTVGQEEGAIFNVLAPNAKEVRVIGDFNNWSGQRHVMSKIDKSNIWSLFIPNVKQWDMYKYEIVTKSGEVLVKSDPYAFYSELRPGTASKVVDIDLYKWNDNKWMQDRDESNVLDRPLNIYEVHLGSWKRKNNGDFYTYRELAEELVDYVCDMGYTHIEVMPLTEHPYDGSWGYQSSGYYSITSRYGSPYDFMYFVDKCHEKGIGVILDWVPGHFCKDDSGLRQFDGSPLYEYSELIKSDNIGWGTANFDLGKTEVESFLISNAIFWFDVYHIDGIRVDAVASMLYLDFCKEPGQWVPNKYGGRENLEAVEFIKKLNTTVFKYFTNVLMIAEESTTWPLVTAPADTGGLGFNYKWNMGWMNDMLKYMEMDSIHRKWHHNLITFSFMYAYSENFILPFSHDEVVHGKKSMLDKMDGDYWQKFAGLRTLYTYMIAHPGKKLLFMGSEFGQFIEWRYGHGLDWMLLDYEQHSKMKKYVKDLNNIYRTEKCLWELDNTWDGFEWIDADNSSQSIIAFIRKCKDEDETLLIVCNFTPVVHERYRIGVANEDDYEEIFNSDLNMFGGSDRYNPGKIKPINIECHHRKYSIEITIPPLASVIYKSKHKKIKK